MRFSRAVELVAEERKRQDDKWGREYIMENRERVHYYWPSSPEQKLTILMEEVGEVARAILEHDVQNLREELTQVAALAVAWLEADFNGSEL
jgi:NTP pyrophosphatase (non-canonical NTP hydrolase)